MLIAAIPKYFNWKQYKMPIFEKKIVEFQAQCFSRIRHWLLEFCINFDSVAQSPPGVKFLQ